jgi:hypothetical protein
MAALPVFGLTARTLRMPLTIDGSGDSAKSRMRTTVGHRRPNGRWRDVPEGVRLPTACLAGERVSFPEGPVAGEGSRS